MITTIVTYLGIWGLRALIAWLTALIILITGSFIRSRPRAYLIALIVAIIAYLCANHNHNTWYASIRLDRTDEISAALAQREPQEGLATTVRYAEDDPEDRVEGGAYRPTRDPAAVPAWRQRKALESQTDPAATPGDTTQETPDIHGEQLIEEEAVLYLKADRLSIVRQLERANRLALNLVLLLTLLAILYDYITTFNSIRSRRLTLPLSGALLDSLSPKTRAMVIRTPEKQWQPAALLSRALRKGENVIYFGDPSIWSNTTTLPRLSLFTLPSPIWRIPILRYGSADTPTGSEFAFDAAWFGRYAVVIPATAPVVDILHDIADILQERRRSGARARTTLVIGWHLPDPPDKDLLTTLNRLTDEANLTILIWPPAPAEEGHVSPKPPQEVERASPKPPQEVGHASPKPPQEVGPVSPRPPQEEERASPKPPQAVGRASPKPPQEVGRVSPKPPQEPSTPALSPPPATPRVRKSIYTKGANAPQPGLIQRLKEQAAAKAAAEKAAAEKAATETDAKK